MRDPKKRWQSRRQLSTTLNRLEPLGAERFGAVLPVPVEGTKGVQTLWTPLCFVSRLAVERKPRLSSYPLFVVRE